MPLQVSAAGRTPPAQVSAPPAQVSVPVRQAPIIEPQEPPPPGLPSSVVPSQSSSRPLQRSVVGPTSPAQLSEPPMQVVVPRTHSPVSVPQAAPPPGLLSSMFESQSSSIELQVSVPGRTSPVQTSAPAVQTMVPVEQAPTSEPQTAPPPGFISSVVPSQSSSIALHVS